MLQNGAEKNWRYGSLFTLQRLKLDTFSKVYKGNYKERQTKYLKHDNNVLVKFSKLSKQLCLWSL